MQPQNERQRRRLILAWIFQFLERCGRLNYTSQWVIGVIMGKFDVSDSYAYALVRILIAKGVLAREKRGNLRLKTLPRK